MTLRLSNWLYKTSRGWVALLATLIFILFSIVVLPEQAARADTYSENAGSPDLSGYYRTEDLYRMAEAYGEHGRLLYVRARYTFDLIFPIIYTFFLLATISWVYAQTVVTNSRWRRVNLIPLLAMLLDFLENTSTSMVMLRYPERTVVLDTLAPFFTLTKWIFVFASFTVLVVGVLFWLWGRIGTTKITPAD